MSSTDVCLRRGVLAIAALPFAVLAPLRTMSAQFDRDGWAFQAESASVVTHDGRRALRLVNGIAWLPAMFTDGVIELDMSVTGDMGFSGVMFRMQDPANYEHIYLRSHLSGMPDATQYEPVFNGTGAWQIHTGEGYNAPVPFATRKWIHVRIDVADSVAALYVDSERPVQVIPRLKGIRAAGRVGLTSSIAPAYFANVRVVNRKPLFDVPGIPDPPTAAGAISTWGLSQVFPESTVSAPTRLDGDMLAQLPWTVAASGERGIANIARYRARGPEGNTAFAAVTVRAPEAVVKRLQFGFSDRVRVYLNGQLLFSADDTFRSRDYRFLGTMGLFDELALPLRAGENVLVFAVSEAFGGWGVMAAFPAAGSLVVLPYCGGRTCPP